MASLASEIESEVAADLEEFFDYFSKRAELASKFIQKPQVVGPSLYHVSIV